MRRFLLMKIECQGSLILLVAREEGTDARYVIQVPFRPYFYVPAAEAVRAEKKGLAWEEVSGIASIEGQEIVRVYTSQPDEVGRRKKGFSTTWEADVPYVRRFLIDTGIKAGFTVKGGQEIGEGVLLCQVDDLEPAENVQAAERILYYDIETRKMPNGRWSRSTEAKGQVTCITLHDTFVKDEVLELYWHPDADQNRPQTDVVRQWSPDLQREVTWRCRRFGTEEEMLMAWVQYLKDHRPDTLAAWNGHKGFQRKNQPGFDVPYLINRLNRLGIGATQMSPFNRAWCGYTKPRKNQKTGMWRCTIDGIQLVDLMTVYQVKDGGFTGDVPFSGLKAVYEAKRGKTLKKDPAALDDWWMWDTEEFLLYAFRDVTSMMDLEEQETYVAWAREIQRFAGVEDLDIVLRPGTLVGTMERRIAFERGQAIPTSETSDEEGDEEDDIKGGYVIDPREWGLMDNVIVLDLERMYVAVMQSCNISYETYLGRAKCASSADLDPACPGCCLCRPGEVCTVPTEVGPVSYRLDLRGISPTALDLLSQLRDRYDKLIEQETDIGRITDLKKARDPAKKVLLTTYGWKLNENNPLFRTDDGRAVTGTGRAIIQMADRLCADLGVLVIRGDTDSLFIKVPEGEDPVEFGVWLEERINRAFDDLARSFGLEEHNFQIGLESVLSPFVSGVQKKYYAAWTSWAEGSYQERTEKTKPLIKGLPGIKSDAAKITRETTDKVIRALLDKVPPREVLSFVRTIYDSICRGEMPVEDVVKGVRLNFDVDNDHSTSYVLSAAKAGKELLGYNYDVGSRVSVVRVKGVPGTDWMAVPEGDDIPQDFAVDWQYHADATVISPLEGVFSWVGMSEQLVSIQRGSMLTVQKRF